jgi:hypothetical protein
MMNSEVKAKWLEALRSGRYRQRRHYLHTTDDSFCCLGVLCDLYSLEGKGFWSSHSDCKRLGSNVEVMSFAKNGNYSTCSADLPDYVAEWAGLRTRNPRVFAHDESTSLAALNDNGETFGFIASIIEDQL